MKDVLPIEQIKSAIIEAKQEGKRSVAFLASKKTSDMIQDSFPSYFVYVTPHGKFSDIVDVMIAW